MNVVEVASLLEVVRGLWPASHPAAAKAWQPTLDDLPFALAYDAVVSLGRVQKFAPTAAEVRREVARAAGLLAPDVDLAFQEANVVASAEGVGRSLLPAPVQEAYDACGGSLGIRSGRRDAVWPRFRDAYRVAVERHDRVVLAPGLGQRAAQGAIGR